MGKLILYETFKEKQRIKKYGDPGKRLRAMNFNEDYNPFTPEYEADEYHRVCNGEIEEEDDYWMGEKDLTHFIR